jgi:hypothetical protein
MPNLTVQAIGVDRLAQVYPLIRAATRVSLDRWQDFGRALLRDGGGVLAITADDECVHGVAAYRPGPNLRHEQSLDVEVIVAFELRGEDLVRKRLCRELETIAVERGCATLNFTVDAKNAEPASSARSGFERLGLKLDTASFVRELP